MPGGAGAVCDRPAFLNVGQNEGNDFGPFGQAMWAECFLRRRYLEMDLGRGLVFLLHFGTRCADGARGGKLETIHVHVPLSCLLLPCVGYPGVVAAHSLLRLPESSTQRVRASAFLLLLRFWLRQQFVSMAAYCF